MFFITKSSIVKFTATFCSSSGILDINLHSSVIVTLDSYTSQSAKNQNSSYIDTDSNVVMGQGPSPARARPGALGFWRALGPTFGEGLKPGPGPGPWSKARGLKGLLEY